MRALTLLLGAALACLGDLAAAQDLSALPDYRPEQQVSGVLRSRGSTSMAALMSIWESGFRKYHPGIAFEDHLKGNASAMIGLEESIADFVVMNRKIVPYDIYGVWRRAHHVPVEIVVGSGSFDVPKKSFALTVFVNKDNPVSQLTLKQLDGIFGAHRTGGWQGMDWRPDVARSASEDLTTWGQVGATGDWAKRPIHPFGPPGLYPGGMSFFQIKVLGGADTSAENLQEFADGAKMMAAMSLDPDAIAYTSMSYKTPQAKALAIADTAAGPYVTPSRETVSNGTYPLARSIYVYLPPDAPNGDAWTPKVDPKVREFLRYILSRQGQEDIVREGDFLPLPDDVLRDQRQKLD